MKKKWIMGMLVAALVCQTPIPAFAAAADTSIGMESREESAVKAYLTEAVEVSANPDNNNEAPEYEVPAEELDFFKGLGSGTVTVSFKTTSTALQALMAINGSAAGENYMSLYISNGNRIGLEFRKTPTDNDHQYVNVSDVNLANGKWHTITLSVSENQYYKIYLDKELVYTRNEATTNFTKTMDWEPTSVTLGGAKRTSGNNYLFTGSLKEVKFFNSAISETEILLDHSGVEEDQYAAGTVKTEEYGIFDMGDYDAFNYRIPALATTSEGTLIAAADKRNTHWSDNGNIDTVIRRSTDNGKTWEDPIDVIDLKTQPYFQNIQSAYTIDPTLLAEDGDSGNPGRIWMLVDMFPECSGTWSSQAGSGYITVGGQKYLGLYDSEGNEYTVREQGVVYNNAGQATDYRVAQQLKMPFHEYGDLYQGEEYVGNIYLKSTQEGNDTAPLTVYVTDHLVLNYSDDDGKTWSEPRDLNPEVKESWMKFIGTGPGVGIQVKRGEYAGRLIFPIYYTNQDNKQSSANIYSDDGGLTWHRGESPNDGRINGSGQTSNSQEMNGLNELTESQIVELNNGHLMQFMRNTGGPGKVAVAVSTDGGETWGQVSYTEATEVYCQLSVLHYPELIDGNECVILSNPGGSGRNNGTLRIGKINEDDSIDWMNTKVFRPGNYAYSCLTVMDDGNLGLLYEHQNTIKFTSFNVDYIKDPVNKINPKITDVSYTADQADPSKEHVLEGDTLNLTVTLDQTVYTTGVPTLRMNFNGTYRHAAYVSGGNGNAVMTFAYVVQKGDEGSISFKGPKIVCDTENYVKNKNGLSVSSGDLDVSLGMLGPDPNEMEGDVPLGQITATAGNFQTGEGPEKVLDGDANTLWHTDWNGTDRSNHWIVLDLEQEYSVNGLRYLPRSEGSNGIITKYRIEVSLDNVNFTPVQEGNWAGNHTWKNESFDSVKARYVRLVSLESISDQNNKEFTSAAEIRVQAEEFGDTDDVIEAPGNLKAENITWNSAVISWEAPSGSIAAAGYRVVYGIAGQPGQEVETDGAALSVFLENLKEMTEYEVQAIAIDAEGNESEAAVLSFRTEKEDTPVKPADKKALEDKIQKAKGYLAMTDTYEAASLQNLKNIAAQAEALWNNEKAGQAAVDAMVQKLEQAIAGLVKKPEPPVTEVLKAVKLNKTKQTLGVNEKLTLKATPSPAKAKLGTLKWKSSNPKVATVSSKGVVKAKKAGKTTISVTSSNGKKANCKITVKKAPKSVAIKPQKKTLKIKKSLQLKAVLSKGSAGKVTFKSNNKKVASVTAAGKVTSRKKGKVTITATTYNKKKAKITLTIK